MQRTATFQAYFRAMAQMRVSSVSPRLVTAGQCLERLSCSCAALSVPQKATLPAQPGTVTPYGHHVLIRLPLPEKRDEKSGIWWPPILEKHPALVQAFAAVAESKQHIDGTVKVSAYEEMDPSYSQHVAQGHVDMLIFPAGVEFKGVHTKHIKEAVREHVTNVAPNDSAAQQISSNSSKGGGAQFEGIALFVCTHMSRDSRCGVVGREAAEKLLSLIEEQDLNMVKVYQVSHIGGHKYAGNVLVYGSISPCDGDWFGGVTKANAGQFLDALLHTEIGIDGGVENELLRTLWRGRLGLSKEEQIETYEEMAGIEKTTFTDTTTNLSSDEKKAGQDLAQPDIVSTLSEDPSKASVDGNVGPLTNDDSSSSDSSSSSSSTDEA